MRKRDTKVENEKKGKYEQKIIKNAENDQLSQLRKFMWFSRIFKCITFEYLTLNPCHSLKNGLDLIIQVSRI